MAPPGGIHAAEFTSYVKDRRWAQQDQDPKGLRPATGLSAKLPRPSDVKRTSVKQYVGKIPIHFRKSFSAGCIRTPGSASAPGGERQGSPSCDCGCDWPSPQAGHAGDQAFEAGPFEAINWGGAQCHFPMEHVATADSTEQNQTNYQGW